MENSKNHDALSDFVSINGLSKSNGWTFFEGNVTIRTEKNTFEGIEKIRIWFSGVEYGNVNIEITKKFDIKKYPSTFWVSRQDYSLKNNSLVITGIFPSPIVGRYTCTITPV